MKKKSNKKIVYIGGMTCQSCEILLEKELKNINGVTHVTVNHRKGLATIYSKPGLDVFNQQIKHAIKNDTYTVIEYDSTGDNKKDSITLAKSTQRERVETFIAFLLIILLYFVLKNTGIIPEGYEVNSGMSLWMIFILGIVASLSTCLAVTGGLLLAISAKYNEKHIELTMSQKMKPQILFNLGRIGAYAFFGGIIGTLGSAISLSPTFNGIITVLAAIAMIVLGFQILHIFPKIRLKIPYSNKFGNKLHNLTDKNTFWTPTLLGAGTFFLPCGFTQALQLLVLSIGGFSTGAMILGIFALGTTPVLLTLGTISSISQGNAKRWLMKFAGVIAIFVGLFSFQSGLSLLGVPAISLSYAKLQSNNTNTADTHNVIFENGTQIIKMDVDFIDYVPHQFTVKKGIPVRWEIDTTRAAGCMTSLTSRGLGINTYLGNKPKSIVEFTPRKTGIFPFSCSMGMGTYGAAITVIN